MQKYLDVSPASYAQDIHTPLLILHSEEDLRCPVEQAEHLFVSLRLLKRPVEMVRFPEESHELTRSGSPLHRVRRFQIILEFMDRHLKDGGGARVSEARRVAPHGGHRQHAARPGRPAGGGVGRGAG